MRCRFPPPPPRGRAPAPTLPLAGGRGQPRSGRPPAAPFAAPGPAPPPAAPAAPQRPGLRYRITQTRNKSGKRKAAAAAPRAGGGVVAAAPEATGTARSRGCRSRCHPRCPPGTGPVPSPLRRPLTSGSAPPFPARLRSPSPSPSRSRCGGGAPRHAGSGEAFLKKTFIYTSRQVQSIIHGLCQPQIFFIMKHKALSLESVAKGEGAGAVSVR